MTLRPKTPIDLALAPVAAEIDLNLQEVRDEGADKIVDAVAFTLNTSPAPTREGRAEQIRELAIRGVDLHGWAASISDDATRIQLRGGSVSHDVGLSASIRAFVEG